MRKLNFYFFFVYNRYFTLFLCFFICFQNKIKYINKPKQQLIEEKINLLHLFHFFPHRMNLQITFERHNVKLCRSLVTTVVSGTGRWQLKDKHPCGKLYVKKNQEPCNFKGHFQKSSCHVGEPHTKVHLKCIHVQPHLRLYATSYITILLFLKTTFDFVLFIWSESVCNDYVDGKIYCRWK